MTERSKFLDRFPATPPPPLNAPAQPAAQQQVPPTEQYFASVDARPPTFTPAPAPAKRSKAVPIVIVCLLVFGGVSTLFAMHASKKPLPPPKILPPSATATAIPTSLSDVTREEAESYRHTALQTVEQAGSSDPSELQQMQPNFQWVAGTSPSTTQTMMSVGQDSNGITIAVTAANKQICAFGRWSPNAGPTYVDVEYQRTCAAVDAPATGWSTQPGGSNQDLPDDPGS